MTPGVPLTCFPKGSHVRRHKPGEPRGSYFGVDLTLDYQLDLPTFTRSRKDPAR